jgi:hypothetical protein
MNAGAAVAGGRWILFLHADSELPADWHTVIADLEPRADIVAGAFRLTLDSADWRARLIEAGVRLRVALLGLPYGDQALFVRRHVFARLGGYRDLPLMEDIEFVRRVSKAGRVVHSRAAVLTSARRWERDGWMRRSVHPQVQLFEFDLRVPRDLNAVCHACGAADRTPAAQAWSGQP